MNGYEKRTQEKRSAIIRVAQELFSQNGISKVSITDIADKANVSRVTLFKYFGDKESLAKEAMQIWVEHLVSEYKAIVSSNIPFQKKLLLLIETRISGREKIGEQFIDSTAWDDPEMTRLLQNLVSNRTFPSIMNFLQEGREAGYIDENLDDEAILVYLSAFTPIVQNPDYIKKGKSFQISIFNLFMGGLIKNWYEIQSKS